MPPLPDRDQAVEGIFRALATHDAQALRVLRDGADDADTLRRWAASHRLLCDAVVNYAGQLRSWWSQNPRAATALRTGCRITLIPTGRGTWSTIASREQERQRLESERRVFNLSGSEFPLSPEPPAETLRHWLKRATQVYRDLEKIRAQAAMECRGPGVPRAGVQRPRICSRGATFRYAEGFVLRQKDALTDFQIARRLKRDPQEAAAIGHGARLIATATSIPLRRAKRK